jgi:hypothetical protein
MKPPLSKLKKIARASPQGEELKRLDYISNFFRSQVNVNTASN